MNFLRLSVPYRQRRLKCIMYSMKYIFLAIFVFLAAQPLQASLCDMCDAQETSQAQHGDMNDMDCCDQEPDGSSDNCDPMSHCGACTAGVVAVSADTAGTAIAISTHRYQPGTAEFLHRVNPPPFRPPIS